ncbi:hypothetical protein L596_001832 [Steinernema carpocapsae]|uniref:Secreted protein n=1 Tax=Steinernema carpocapsae TaxID=34508 RepID=A0A4V6I7I0_STECR|nr:hypothetical protein L596_001832 [Steinernema carpocapsae]
MMTPRWVPALICCALILIQPTRSGPEAEEFDQNRQKDANLPGPVQMTRIVQAKMSANEEKDDESCVVLQVEFREICFAAPPSHAVAETEAFCDAFRDMCKNLLTRTPNLPTIDHTAYCRKHKERFDFVCPKPLRFGSYVDEAVAFCTRYRGKCPDAELPSDVIPYKKPKKHIWIKEIAQYCDRNEKWAKVYCIIPAVLKVQPFGFACWWYKMQCIDILNRVGFYGWPPNLG